MYFFGVRLAGRTGQAVVCADKIHLLDSLPGKKVTEIDTYVYILFHNLFN